MGKGHGVESESPCSSFGHCIALNEVWTLGSHSGPHLAPITHCFTCQSLLSTELVSLGQMLSQALPFLDPLAF